MPAIDYEHWELIELLNAIIDTLEKGGETEPLVDFLGDVNAGITAHFALEEQVMRKRRYDHYSDHKADHERLRDDIRDIMDGFADGTYADRREELAVRLHDSFFEHSKTLDARLHKHLHG